MSFCFSKKKIFYCSILLFYWMEETTNHSHGMHNVNGHSHTANLAPTTEVFETSHGEVRTKKRCRMDDGENGELVGKLQRVRLLEEGDVEGENVHYVDVNRMLGEVHQEMVERRQGGGGGS